MSQFNLSNAKSSAFKVSRSISFAIERVVHKGNPTKLFAEKLRVTSIISDNMLKSDSKSLFSGTPILFAEGQFVACHFSPSNYVPFRKIGKKHLEEELRRAMCTEDRRADALFEVGKNSPIKMKKKKKKKTQRRNLINIRNYLYQYLTLFDVICDLLLNRRTATCNLFVLYNK